MAQQNRVGFVVPGFRDDLVQTYSPEFRIQQLHPVAGVQQRAAQGEQTERRQMLARDATANRRMRWVDEQNFHNFSIHYRRFVAGGRVSPGLLGDSHFVLQSV